MRRYAVTPRQQLRKQLWSKQRHRCPLCKAQIRRRTLYTAEVNIDHIRPKSHGGTDHKSNLQLVHKRCNELKADTCKGCPGCP